jgi:calcineurin-like phosphoesterase family protein
MNTALVDNINNKVGENDVLIHLGDWSFGGFEMIEEFRSRIVCKNIHLVLGNHDHHIDNDKNGIKSLFSSVNHYINLDLRRPINKATTEKFKFVLMHFPIASWDNMNTGVIHLHGHVHLPPHLRIADGRAMDVGVDGNDLEPISLNFNDDFSGPPPTPSVSFGTGIELLMNDKKKSSSSSVNIDLGELDKIEDELNELTDKSSASAPSSETKTLSGFASNLFGFGKSNSNENLIKIYNFELTMRYSHVV